MIVVFTFVLVFVIPIFLFEWWIRSKQRKFKMPPKHPKCWPVIGAAPLLFEMKDTKCLLRLSENLAEIVHKAGGLAYGNLGPLLVYGITDTDDCNTVLNTCLQKKFVYNLIKRWLGDGLIGFTDNLTLWKRHRKIINRAFSQQILDIYLNTFNGLSKQLIRDLARKVNTGSFEHTDMITDYFLEVMYRTTMGFEEDQVTEDIFPKEHKEAFHTMLNLTARRLNTYWMHSDFLYSFSSLKRKEDETLNLLKTISKAVLRTKREILNNSDKKSKKPVSFIDLLLDLPPEEAFTDEEIIGELDNMIIAGSDTTATVFSYVLVVIGTYQDIQQEVYEELITVLGDSPRDVEKGDVPKLVYLEAVLMETLRLYPMIPVLPRYVSEDTKLKNYTIPAGSDCLILVKHIHTNPELWGDDAALYRPHRWIEGVPPAAQRGFAGFSLGKRGCIGKMHALMSMKTTLAHILRHYKIVADVTKLKLQLDVMLKPASGCDISLLPRRQDMSMK